MRHLALMAVLLFLLIHTAVAETIATAGAGESSCARFLKETSDESGYPKDIVDGLSFGYFSWAQGFMTALNFPYINEQGGLSGVTDLSDTDGQQAWLDNYCRQYPLRVYWVSVIELWLELRRVQGLKPDPRFPHFAEN